MIREIPVSTSPAQDKPRVALNYSLPLFVSPPGGGELKLAWSVSRLSASDIVLHVSNTGTVHAKITALRLAKSPSPDAPLAQVDTLHYVLPGATRDIPLTLPPDLMAGDQLRLWVEVNSRQLDVPLTVR
jgi:P pilus assembly chaperone PapD